MACCNAATHELADGREVLGEVFAEPELDMLAEVELGHWENLKNWHYGSLECDPFVLFSPFRIPYLSFAPALFAVPTVTDYPAADSRNLGFPHTGEHPPMQVDYHRTLLRALLAVLVGVETSL
jgi:hypothetical protein